MTSLLATQIPNSNVFGFTGLKACEQWHLLERITALLMQA